MDKYFRVEVVNKMSNPQQLVYAAAHQDYCEDFVWDEQYWRLGDAVYEHDDDKIGQWPSEEHAGELVIKMLLKGNKGHFGPLEHAQIVFNCGWFNHATMQQLRTHRVGVSFDCQSMRYTGQRIIDVANGSRDVEEVFYLRPVGTYSDRQGSRYEYCEELRECHKARCLDAANNYASDVLYRGLSEEHARGMIPFDVRQHWFLSCNLRSLMHLLAIRGKADAQLECQWLCQLILPHFQAWAPQVYQWFYDNQWQKGRLAP